MIRAILIDDEPNNLENLKIMLANYCPDVSVIGEAASVRQSSELVSRLDPELLFLDIEMPGESGFDLLAQIKNIRFEVIFVTAYNNYALKAIKFNALDYILKPIDTADLTEAVNRAKQRLADKSQLEFTKLALQNLQLPRKSKRIALASADKIEFFDINTIIRCLGENNYTRFFFENGESRLISKPLSEYEELLTDFDFIRVHKSHLVNGYKISSFIKKDGGYILTSDGCSVPVSRRKKDELLERMKILAK
ncbi:MAG: LytTR family DNA-binding domain-containing protein [Prolixibacteraceae bacterium]